MPKILVKFLFLALGLGLFVWAILAVDIKSVLGLITQLGWGLFWVLAIYSIVTWVDTISWQYAFKPAEAEKLSLWNLWKIRQIGEAFNIITPFGTVGGEPLKAQLIKVQHGLTFKQGIASQVVARTTFLGALIGFMIPGIIILILSDTATGQFKIISSVLLVIFTICIFLFFLFQARGSLGRVTGWLTKPFPSLKGSDFLNQMKDLDELMSSYYQNHADRLGTSVLYALAGWIIGLGELYVTLYFLGADVQFFDLWIMEAVSQLIRVCSFFIPLSLGAQEGGLILIFSSIGFTADLGLAVSFVRRIKELLWVGLGLALGGGAIFRSRPASN
ncbi:MAG: flippase-like domain-containing protein [Candidatus Nitronauta litoralis]|uniref:Flippase-like domain-containing protein n=1 Tax=Candidatus Nitronauta litoralis TaxID=2705533 RepID=A0A7T0BYB7_9BACT|nr:MAG: flippase-like domain-containing protein [Candidatus Nitronauta litoralis]